MFKIGILSILLFATVLLIPATSIANAQEYGDRYGKVSDRDYEDDRYYKEIQYNDRGQYYEDEQYIYEEYYYPSKDKKKEPPMVLVKKDVLYCDLVINGTDSSCGDQFAEPNSERYIQECTATEGDLGEICDTINEGFFNIIITDNIEFPGSEDGKKLTSNGERFTVIEEESFGERLPPQAFIDACLEAGFDDGFAFNIPSPSENPPGIGIGICSIFEGDCSGIVQDGELKECTVKNYLVVGDTTD